METLTKHSSAASIKQIITEDLAQSESATKSRQRTLTEDLALSEDSSDEDDQAPQQCVPSSAQPSSAQPSSAQFTSNASVSHLYPFSVGRPPIIFISSVCLYCYMYETYNDVIHS